MVQFIPTVALSRARGLSMRTHLTAVEIHIAKNLFSIRHEWYKNLGDNTVLAREMVSSGCRPRLIKLPINLPVQLGTALHYIDQHLGVFQNNSL